MLSIRTAMRIAALHTDRLLIHTIMKHIIIELIYLLTLGACARVTVIVLCVSVCVCLSVCYRASGYIPRLYVENKMPLGFL